MAVGDFTLIRDLDVLKDMFTMKLHIIRLWTLEDYYYKDKFFSIQLILMDEQGNNIQGYVPNAYIYKFRKLLKEGEAYFIKNRNLAKMDEGKFQLTGQMRKLTFNRETTFISCLDFSGPVNGFAFIDYHPIIVGTVPQNISLDVIGLVVAIGEIDARNEDRKMHKMRLQIQEVKLHPKKSKHSMDRHTPSICKVYQLTKNMRLTVGSDTSVIQKTMDFAKWLLDIGEGKLGGSNDGKMIIDIPNDLLINDPYDPIGSLLEFVYPLILEASSILEYFQERAILAPKNEVVGKINDRLLALFSGDEVEYLSLDKLCESEFVHDHFDANLYSPDVLNGLKVSGLPNHKLVLKIGVPVMLLRNIDKKKWLM
uniref:ATP-dependent DNA helicase n=2 Tax=Lactuca sativa TaxID=4236 RepID=A0A9R1VFB7_LACSA|nr:hypothetical protein LSAT_V11C500252930 [Lactuca sativa]